MFLTSDMIGYIKRSQGKSLGMFVLPGHLRQLDQITYIIEVKTPVDHPQPKTHGFQFEKRSTYGTLLYDGNDDLKLEVAPNLEKSLTVLWARGRWRENMLFLNPKLSELIRGQFAGQDERLMEFMSVVSNWRQLV